MTDDLIGKQIGGYEILDVIGVGGMATVYRAQQVSMNRVVAIKVLPKQYVNDDTYMQRFHREVEIVAKLEHRNIVPVHDYGQYEGQPYIVMRYMPAGSVDDLLAHGPLDVEKILSLVEQISPALDYAHSKSVLHRDLKPSNVLMDDDGGAYLTDFGIARILGEQPGATITQQGVVGTPSYMSPEQAQGQPLDNRSDIYALGIMLFEMATGRRPFHSDTPYGIAVMQVTTPPPSPRSFNPDLSIPVEQVIYKALKKRKEERYSNAVTLAEGLRRALDPPSSSIHDTQPGIPRPTKPVTIQRQAAPAPVMPPAAPRFVAHTPPRNPPVSSAAIANAWRQRRKKPEQGRGLWFNAALGGLIGCGLLTLVVIIAAIIISSMQASAPTMPQRSTRGNSIVQTQIPTLDPTSEAYWEEITGRASR
jgi:serine/threonine-protein kinase